MMKEVTEAYNKFKKEIEDEFNGEVGPLSYRGRMLYWDTMNENRNSYYSATNLESLKGRNYYHYFPAYEFVYSIAELKYKGIILYDKDNENIYLKSGKQFCFSNLSSRSGIFDTESKIRNEIELGLDANHFTPHPTCKILEESP